MSQNKPDQALVAAWMESLEFEFIDRQKHYPSSFTGYWIKVNGELPECAITNDAATSLYQAHVAAVAEAKESVAFAIVSTKTEGIIDDGDVFIKQEPLNQTIINIVGYEKFKAMQEAVDVPPKQEESDTKT